MFRVLGFPVNTYCSLYWQTIKKSISFSGLQICHLILSLAKVVTAMPNTSHVSNKGITKFHVACIRILNGIQFTQSALIRVKGRVEQNCRQMCKSDLSVILLMCQTSVAIWVRFYTPLFLS